MPIAPNVNGRRPLTQPEMTDSPDPSDGPSSEPDLRSVAKRPLLADLIIPVLTIAFAVYYLSTVWELSWQANAAGIGIASAMTIVLLLLAIRFARQWAAGEAALSPGPLAFPRTHLLQRIGLLAAALGFVFVMPYLGFTLGLFVFLMAAILLLAGFSRLKAALAISLCVSIGGYLLFIVVVRARLPRGPVEALLGWLF